MPSLAQSERQRLCETALLVGPDAPTLSGEWTVRDLLAHLVVRESDPVGAPGIVVEPLAFLTERRMRRLARTDFADLVEKVRHPALWAPARLPRLEHLLNTLEFFVHHEDIRRARPGWTGRPLPAADEKLLWSMIRTAGKGLTRRAPVGVRIENATTGSTAVLKDGDTLVTVRGLPSEISLFVFGRRPQAVVEVLGDPADVVSLSDHSLGI